MFQDIGDEYLVSDEHVVRGKFLGKGAFGAVYAGSMIEKRTGNTVSVAMKMLQPVPPGNDATGSQKAFYQKERDRWRKEPLKNCCQSYLNVRKELSILLTLRHGNIVPLLGICLHPLCLVLSLAPRGALSETLENYRRAGARLAPLSVRAVVLQVASALTYLHSCQIIYRDLKAENVLVWSLPPPHYTGHTPHPVKVRLADYGVSRTVLPSGVKGLAGTPPFIAPEIIQHNGEEPYTEKVDCFSFGMFLYEMIMLKLPFDGEGSALGGANLKVHIMAGGRPIITHKDLSLPTHFLDLMSFCWSVDPADRPSAADIVSLASRPQFSHLQNVISLDSGLDVSCASAAPTWQLLDKPGRPFTQEGVSPCSDVWIALRSPNGPASSQGRIHVYTYHQMECVHAKSLSVELPVIACMCVTDHWMWCADVNAVIHVFSLQDYTEVLTFPATSRPGTRVKAMAYGRPEAQLYVVLDNGHFIVCTVNIPVFEMDPDYSPVKTVCPGNGKLIHCISVLLRTPSCSELWCGQSGGCISVWNLDSTKGSLVKLQHPPPPDLAQTVSRDVVFVVTCPQDSASMWSYVYPGSILYRWNTATMKLCGQTDLSQSLSHHGRQPTNHCPQSSRLHYNASQVTAMVVSGEYLHVGTTGGRVFIVDKLTMTPITTLHCHGDDAPYIRAILPLLQPTQGGDLRPSAGHDDALTNAGVVTIGKGYREMFGRILSRHQLKVDKSLTYMLCWMHEHWRENHDVH